MRDLDFRKSYFYFSVYLDIICKIPHTVPISAHHKWNYDSLLEKMWDYLKLVRIYTKPKGQVQLNKNFNEIAMLYN